MIYTKEQLNKLANRNGGDLNLSETEIISLPENLTVGGYLNLSGTKITSLPENLTVGGGLYLSETEITNKTNYKILENGKCKAGEYIYSDNILTHIKKSKKIKKYTYYIGKIPNKNVIFDGKNYAHCKSIVMGIADLKFKELKDRGQSQYLNLTIDSIMSIEAAIAMYRIITGACESGTADFVSNLREPKKEYTLGEIIEITKGQYNHKLLKAFFEKIMKGDILNG